MRRAGTKPFLRTQGHLGLIDKNLFEYHDFMKKQNLKGRNFLTLGDFSKDEINYLIDLAAELKKKKKGGEFDKSLSGKLLEDKNIVLIFDKTSTRTRCSFEVAGYDEGANVTFLTNSQMGKKESLEDTANVLGRYYDGIEYRGFKHSVVEDLAKYSKRVVWNGLTDDDHPTQVLADFLAAKEHLNKDLDTLKIAFVGDGRNNVSNALLIGASKVGMDISIGAPKSLFPKSSLLEKCSSWAKESGSNIVITDDKYEAVKDADIIYTDIWCSMGEEALMEERIRLLKPYQVDMDLMHSTGKDTTIFEHCLPSFHDRNTEIGEYVYEKYGLKEMEVTDEVFRSSRSVVFDEAENRVHTIKAVMVATLSDKLN